MSKAKRSSSASTLCTIVSLLVAAPLPGASQTQGAGPASCDVPTRLTDFGVEGAIGAKWNAASSTLAYGKPRADKRYATYLSDANGANERRLTYSEWADDTHQFPAAWHPSGKYLVVTVEKSSHRGSAVDATPGYGAYSDYWLVLPDGSHAWRLVTLPGDRDHAITHAAFSPDGSRFVWTERIKAPNLLNRALFAGSYRFNVATFVDGENPHLIDTQSFIPGGKDQGGEVESISADDRTIAFYSTYVSNNLFASRIYTMDTRSGDIRELTSDSWSQAPTFTPDDRHIVYMSGSGADIFWWSLQGADWWIMNRDGSNKRRLTFMNRRGSAQSVGKFRLAGSLSFESGFAFYGDVMTKSFGLVGKIVRVAIDPACVE